MSDAKTLALRDSRIAVHAAILEDLPAYFQKEILELDPYFLGLDIEELITEPSLYQLGVRQNFWRAIKLKKRDPLFEITTQLIAGNFMTLGGLVAKIKEPKFLAWLLTPPMEEQEFLDAVTELGRHRLVEIFKFPLWKVERDKHNNPIVDPNSSTGAHLQRPDIQAAKIVAQAFEMLDKRKHGEYTQKILQKGQVEHIHEKKDGSSPSPQTLEEINAQILKLETDAKRIAIDIDPTPLAPRARTQAQET